MNQSDAEVLAQLLATEVANSGRYAVLPRTSTIETAMKEHAIQRSGLTETENIQALGKALNAKYVLAGKVARLGQTNMFTGQILNVETGSMVIGDFENYSAVNEGLTKIATLGGKLTAAAPLPENYSIQQAVNKGFNSIRNNIPRNSRIAILNIDSQYRNQSQYVIDELFNQFVTSNFRVIDESNVNMLRREQNFQVNGNVSDESALRLGRMLNADLIINGRISGSGNIRQLTIRVIKVQNGMIVATSSESF